MRNVTGLRGKKSSSVEKIKSGAPTTCRNPGGATTRASRRKTRGTDGTKVDGGEARNVTPPRLVQSIGILFDFSLTAVDLWLKAAVVASIARRGGGVIPIG
jgi:hypothetical protein